MRLTSSDEKYREGLRARLRPLLDSRRHYATVDWLTFFWEANGAEGAGAAVSAPIWVLRICDEWASKPEIPMCLEDYVSGMVFGQAWDGTGDLLKIIERAPKIDPSSFGR